LVIYPKKSDADAYRAETMTMGFVIFDPDEGLVLCNHNYRDIFRRSPKTRRRARPSWCWCAAPRGDRTVRRRGRAGRASPKLP
jgi:hypothetical protein